jgi:hypothetical protein
MQRAFEACHKALKPDGRLVVAFANKDPRAWTSLLKGLLRAGFTVTASWPIQTEMGNRTRALSSAALASSVWLVCRKREARAPLGWDEPVLEAMRARVNERLLAFWKSGINGPDLVWAATGPALEVYSRYPAVKKADEPDRLMDVEEFLTHVRRLVVEFAVGQVLVDAGTASGDPAVEADDPAAAAAVGASLDAPTAYYLLHRRQFQLQDAPAGPCILYALSCDTEVNLLADRLDLLARAGGREVAEEGDEEGEEDAGGESAAPEGTGSRFRLKAWRQRRRSGMGYDPQADGAVGTLVRQGDLFPEVAPAMRTRGVPLIDQIHRLMHLWDAGDRAEVDDYLTRRGLRRNELFRRVLQAVLELARKEKESEELRLIESLSNYLTHRETGVHAPGPRQLPLAEVAPGGGTDHE